MLKMNGIEMEGCKLRLGFGKSYPSKCVWITGIKQLEDNNLLLTFLADCGPIITCSFDEINKRAIVYFKEVRFNLIISLPIFVYVLLLKGCQILIKC